MSKLFSSLILVSHVQLQFVLQQESTRSTPAVENYKNKLSDYELVSSIDL